MANACTHCPPSPAMASACTNLTAVVRSVRLFKFDGFSLAVETMVNAESIKTRWNVDGHEWEIRCYPASWKGQYWVTLQLMLLGEALTTCNVRASLGCRLVYPTGASQEKSVSHVFKRPKDISPAVQLVERCCVLNPGYPKDDYLMVQCTITVLKEPPVTTVVPPVPISDMHRHFGELLRSGTGADATFVVSGESFAAHKLILAARSPVFMAEFFGDMRESSSRRVEVEEMEAAVFRALLGFIYTDAVLELDQPLEAVTVMAQHLLAAADRYRLDRLKLICEGKLSGGITVETAAATLALAEQHSCEQHSCEQLKAKCVEFVVSTPAILDAVVATEGYKHLEASCPSVLTEPLKSMRARKN